MRAIDRIRKDRRVEFLDIEDDVLMVQLRQGWSFDPTCDNRVRGERTASMVIKTLRDARPYAGPYDP
jgi:hypothetical protein